MPAKVIVIAASKGGSGKTTLTAALGVHVAGLGQQVNLVDADPQQSLGLWLDRREWPTNPNCTLLGSAVDALADYGEVLQPSIRYHEGHPASMVMGQTAAEIKGPSSRVAKAEIAALWNAISKHPALRKKRA